MTIHDTTPVAARRATARDVAARAKVSLGTVSKTFTGNGSVSPATREKVLKAAAELGYSGRALDPTAIDPVGTVGLITSDRFGRLTIPVLLGAIEALAESEHALIVCDGRGDPIREQHFIDSLLRRRVSGILVTGTGISARDSIGSDLPIPSVYALCWSRDPDDVSIVPDDAAGAAAVAKHLLMTGRTRIAFVSGPSHVEDSTQLRLRAVEEMLASEGLRLVHEPLYGEWTEGWGRRAAAQLVSVRGRVDAIICGNDQIARGAVEALRELDVVVPTDVAVTGFDDWDVMVEASRPRLSTVDLNLNLVGRTAALELLRLIEGGTRTVGISHVATRLIPRESTAVL